MSSRFGIEVTTGTFAATSAAMIAGAMTAATTVVITATTLAPLSEASLRVLSLAARSLHKTEEAAAAPRVTVPIALPTIRISQTPDLVASAADNYC
jgi:hypothetical protein